MNRHLRFLLEALAAAMIAVVGVWIYFMVKGYYLTKTYVPDIIKAYENVEVQSGTVSITWVKPYDWFDYALVFIVIGCMYGLLRLLIGNFIQRKSV